MPIIRVENLGWAKEDIELISYASPMHDIGKVVISGGAIKACKTQPGRICLNENAYNNRRQDTERFCLKVPADG